MLTGRWLCPLRRRVFEPLGMLKSGSALRENWRELERTQYLPESVLKERQWLKLGALLRFAGERNDFYRDRFKQAGIDPGAVSPAELAQLPILTKADVRGNLDAMISRGFDKAALLHFKTGGSTGKALDIYLTEACSELRNACARRHDRWAGWEVGEPVAAVWGNPHLATTFKEKLKNWLVTPFIHLDTMSVSEQSVRAFVSEWEKVRPTLLFGHAHSLFLLARLLSDLHISHLAPKGILSTSMMLLPHERRVIEAVFGVRVTDRYGCEEVSLIASECERHEGMHLNLDNLLVEFLKDDGRPAAAGEQGRIVVTDLSNTAMPFIRYQVEDLGIPSDRRCSCGRGLPLMESVTGRVADFLKKRNGEQVAGISLIENTLTKYPGIDQMQIVQNSYLDFCIKLVAGAGYNQEVEAELTDYFIRTFDGDLRISIDRVGAIEPEPSGKYRFSICRIT
jgi:phenylacetate-CoA ligase